MSLWALDVQQACRNLRLASYLPLHHGQVQVYDMNQANQELVKQFDAAQIWPAKGKHNTSWVRRENTKLKHFCFFEN